MKAGFIGLGKMGQGLARNLLRSGVQLTVYDTQPAALHSLVEAGAQAAASVADLVRQVEVVFTSLPGPAEIEQVVLGAGGVLENMAPGLALFDMSTSSASLAQRMAGALASKGGTVLDAPISGGPAGAASGQLAIWVGGDRAVYERYRPLLQAMGKGERYIGPIGSGCAVKLSHNMVCCTIMLAMAEAFSLGTKAGVDPLVLWEALSDGSLGKMTGLQMLVNQFLPARFDPPAFALKLGHKDVALAAAMGKELGVPLRLGNMTLEEMTEALGRGLGGLDMRAFLTLQTERAGVKIAVDPEQLKAAVERTR